MSRDMGINRTGFGALKVRLSYSPGHRPGD